MKMSSMFKKTVYAILMATLLAPSVVMASNPEFAVFPGSTDSNTRFQYVTEAGGDITDSIRLENKSEETITLKIDALDAFDDAGNKSFAIDSALFDIDANPELPKMKFSENNMHMELSRSGSFIVGSPDSTSEYVGNWITLKDETVKLAPGESKNVEFEINVPKDASQYMTYTGGLLVRYMDESSASEGYDINISTGIAERVYLDVLPKEVIELYLPTKESGFFMKNLEFFLVGIAIALIIFTLVKKPKKKSRR